MFVRLHVDSEKLSNGKYAAKRGSALNYVALVRLFLFDADVHDGAAKRRQLYSRKQYVTSIVYAEVYSYVCGTTCLL